MLSRLVTIGDKTLNVYEWSKISGISRHTIFDRLYKGYSEEEAVFCKKWKNSGKRKYPDEKIKELYESGLSLADVGRALNLSYTRISKRLTLMGIEIDRSLARRKYKPIICRLCNEEFSPTSSKQRKCLKC
jgi:hypothetical protein